MIRELLAEARTANLGFGECLEVHFSNGERGGFARRAKVVEFVDEWGHLMEGRSGLCIKPLGKYVGIVHESGAMLVELIETDRNARNAHPQLPVGH